jgi:hypothetical protein
MAKLESKLTTLGKEVTVTLDLYLTRRLRVRLAIARLLFWLAAKILGCGIVVNDGDPTKGQSCESETKS